MTETCDVIVLNYNRVDLMKRFMESFEAHTHIPCNLIVIDNASTDGSPAYIQSLTVNAPHTIIAICNHDNKGFVGGMNQGMALSRAPYVCLINNDVELTEGWLSEIISVFKKFPELGVLNPNSNNMGNKPSVGKNIDEYVCDLNKAYQGTYIELSDCVGFCMCITRDVMNAVGMLSEEFSPFFYEDTDYSLKAIRAGYIVGVARGAYVWHDEHATFHATKSAWQDVYERNRQLFLKKWGAFKRIVWFEDNESVVRNNFPAAQYIVRRHNLITVYTHATTLDTRKKLFSACGVVEHAGIIVKQYGIRCVLCFRLLVKKKKFDIMVTRNFWVKMLYRMCGYAVYDTMESVREHFNELTVGTVWG